MVNVRFLYSNHLTFHLINSWRLGVKMKTSITVNLTKMILEKWSFQIITCKRIVKCFRFLKN